MTKLNQRSYSSETVFNLVLTSLSVRFTIMANRIINLFRRVPVLKKLFRTETHGNYTLKTVFTLLGVLFVANKKILMHILYMAFLAFAGGVIHQVRVFGSVAALLSADAVFEGITAGGVASKALMVWLFISVFGGIVSSITISPLNHHNDKIMLKYLRANPRAYAMSRILLDRTSEFFLYIPFLYIAFLLAGIPLQGGIFVALVMLTGFRLTGETLNLWMFCRYKKHFGNSKPLMYAGTAVVYTLAFVLPYYIPYSFVHFVFTSPLTLVLSVALCVLAIRYIRRYPLFGEILRDKITVNEMLYAKAEKASAAELQGVQKWSKDLQTDNLKDDKFGHKTGFSYLNAIFFDRHKKFFSKKITFRCAVFLLPLAASLLFSLYMTLVTGQTAGDFLIVNGHFAGANSISDVVTSLFNMAPMLLFVLSMASMSRVVTASAFSNCDIQMLHYPYYRARQTIFASFKSRFGAILKYNLIVTTTLALSLMASVFIIFGEMNFLYTAIFLVMISCAGVFFAFNDLFLYYVIQPYDSAGKSKSIVFSVVNGAIGVAIWMQLQLELTFVMYSVAVMAITAAYLIIGTILLLTLAPKRFKLR